MKKLALLILGLALSLPASAVFVPYSYNVSGQTNPAQPWNSAKILTLTATESSSLWVSSFVSNYYGTLVDLGTIAQMTPGNYGWIAADGTLHSGTGDTKTVSFTNSAGKTISTTAYYVGDFNAGDNIGFWITTSAGTPGYSTGMVQSGVNAGLRSRQINTVDLAGNTRINFGFNSGSVEFIAVGGAPSPSGQPLPGVIASLLIGGGAFGVSKLRKARK